MNALLTKLPLTPTGFSFIIVSTTALKFLIKFSSEKLFFPIDKPTLPSLSFLISTWPDFIFFTALIISFVTVPSLGFGINPLGPKIFPSLPNLTIIFGVDISFSKLIFPAEILLIKSSVPKTSADVFGTDDLINNISAGNINFEKLISTPKMMVKLGKLGKILGPKGLMPNPKLGTVTNEIIKAVKNIKSGQVEIKNDKDGNVGLSIGKKSFSDENLIKNFNAVVDTIIKEKPVGVKGNFVKSAFITSSMGVSYKLKLNKNI